MPIPVAPLATTLPAAATWMPPETMPPLTKMPKSVASIRPLSLIAPLMVLSERTAMPVGPIGHPHATAGATWPVKRVTRIAAPR